MRAAPRIAAGLICGLMALAVPASAQTARPMLDYATAAKIRDGCLAYARDRQDAVAIAIFDDEGRMLSFDQMDGVVNIAGELAQWKARAALNYRVSTETMSKWADRAIPGTANLPGGVPLFTADGAPLGAVGVSGSHANGDLACAKAGVAAAGLVETAG